MEWGPVKRSLWGGALPLRVLLLLPDLEGPHGAPTRSLAAERTGPSPSGGRWGSGRGRLSTWAA